MAALSEVVEAWMEYVGPKEARGLMKVLAARAATPASTVVGIRQAADARHALNARTWLQGRVLVWLMRHG